MRLWTEQLVGKPQGLKILERPSHKCGDNIKNYLEGVTRKFL